MLHRIPSPWERSHEWFINHQSFKSWIESHGHRVLWLQGEPGSGKTVLSKAVVLHLNRLSEGESNAAIVRKPLYFLNDGSDPATQSSKSFVCSILYQILKDSKTAFTIKYLEDIEDFDLFARRLDEDSLWKCLSSIIKRSRGVIFQFVVDAIDKFDPVLETNSVTLLERLERLLAADVSDHMRLLITERKMPDEKFLGHASTSIINLKNESTRQAVQVFTHAQVGGHLDNTRSNPLVGAQVEDEIIEISGGNFLMASLTWKWLSNEAQVWIGDDNKLPLKQVYHLPYDLETFYCGLLNMLPVEWREEIRRAFAVLRVSSERLSSRQLSLFATIWKFGCSTSSFDPRAVEDVRSRFETFLHQRCGDFVRKNENGLVGFAHQTVKDLFSGQSKSAENARTLNQYTMSESDAHSILFQMCMRVLQAESILLTDEEIKCIISHSRNEANELKLPTTRWYYKISIWKSNIQKESKTSCLLYALMNWFEHYMKATPSVALDLEVAQCLQLSRFHMLWMEMTEMDEFTSEMIKFASFPLMNAISRGDSGRLIRAIIESGSEVNFLGPRGITPLSWTILCDRQEAFLALMRSDALSVNYGNPSQSTAVHYAAMSNNPFYINYMVKDSRANLNCRGEYHTTPLLEAIRHGQLGYVLLLLEQPHIDVWAKDSMNRNALTLALQRPMWEDVVLRIMRLDWSRAMTTMPFDVEILEVVQNWGWHHVEDELLSRNSHILLQVDNYTGRNLVSALAYHGRRADLIRCITKLSYDEVIKVATCGKYNLLHLCANQDWHDIVGGFVTNFNLRPVACDHANRTLLHWALDYDWPMSESDLQILIAGNINQRDNNGMTALHLAIAKRNINVARWLVTAQADIFARDKRGFTPAHLAANEGYREGVEFFMNLAKYDYGRTKEGSTMVHLISLWLDGSLLKQFVESRTTSVNSKDQKKRMPLHYAAQTGNVSAARVLLEKGCQVNAKDMDGQTALHHAIRSGHLTLPPVLLENGADVDLVDRYGQTCLHLSIRYRHEEFTEWLISRKTDMIFERDKFGFTPLHRACLNGTTSEVLELLRHGADILEMDSTFRTPLEHAVNARNHDTVRLILQYQNTENHRTREWIRSVNTVLRTAIAKGFPEIEAILMEAGAWIADQSTDRIERYYITHDIREDRWPIVFYTHWDRGYHVDSYDPSTGSV
ncbi:uncharacterized protein BHQ10_007628 [Talaromyces amestolkiae]|uniref:Nephrocystin 3-like N-terminal domain-containing protein n=1 Tax=Talaromyces amestolkiae TaxID=1196081 RepID=A0A364L740_TALAM|nr:uncharacterized protein BHQ10_007628 [Talaromyces amestolkiae]RAO71616.1 hypothetical protein BHQ10_007628 [Talaromyces amestolkiae]